MIMDMIMKSLSNPSTGKMMTGKMKEMFSFLSEQFQCSPKDIGLFLKLEQVPMKDKDGNDVMLEIPAEVSGVEIGEQQIAVKSTPKTEEKAYIYVYVKGEAVQKIAIEQFLALATKGTK